jgi:hypothetical protein
MGSEKPEVWVSLFTDILCVHISPCSIHLSKQMTMKISQKQVIIISLEANDRNIYQSK